MDMIGSAAILWEGRVGLESEVAQLQRGDLDALSALLARYQNRLYRYLLRLVREPAEAEDLFQQTWVRVAGCSQSVPSGFVFCPHCGTPLQATCSNCGRGVERGWSNCPHCGTKLPSQGLQANTSVAPG